MAIINQLHDGKPTLKAAVSIHAARLHLFSMFTLKWSLQPAAFPFVHHLCIPMNVTLRYGTHKTIPLLVGFYRIVSLNVDLFRWSLDVMNAQSVNTRQEFYLGGVTLLDACLLCQYVIPHSSSLRLSLSAD
jgi:hypothetical protein